MQTRSTLKKKCPRRQPLPPGQRLILYLSFACALAFAQVCLWPSGKHPGWNQAQGITRVQPVMLKQPFELQDELKELAAKIKLAADKPRLHAGVFVVEPALGRFVDVDGQQAFPAASMIKLPVFVRLLAALDRQEVRLDQRLVIRADLIGGGSGYLQWRPAGTKISLKETAELMMIVSDNTATNMIIDLLGGKEAFNKDFADWGLEKTRINEWLPDLEGTNKTSPYDLAFLLGKVEQGELICRATRDYMYSVLERTKTRTLLPMGLPPGTKIAHKTGDIGRLVGDGGIVTAACGKRYIVVVQVERPFNDRRANLLIRQLSRDIYASVTGDSSHLPALAQAQKPRCYPHHRRHQRRS